ncbi:craniofacial development protein 2-like [Calliphora vicina]|uniref:craniofacial development protein 2-like n=1 Tax=Calliphora vicina TaxID=7373 RepID=UPI00325B7ECA
MITETETNETKRSDLLMTTFSMKTRTRFGTWNVRTLMEPSRLAQLCKEFMSYKLLFLGISEMRWPDTGEKSITNGLHLLYSGKAANENRASGVGFLFSKEAHKALISWKPYSDRIIAVRLRTRARNLTCIQCYAPTDVSEVEVKDEFYSLLDRAITSSNRGDILVVMGDFNAQTGPNNTGLESVMGVHGLGRKTENGELFVNMCAENSLVIGGTLFPHKTKHKITWVSPDHVTENQIDHIAISRKWRGSLLPVIISYSLQACV